MSTGLGWTPKLPITQKNRPPAQTGVRDEHACTGFAHNFNAAIEMLDQRRACLDPVPAIVIAHFAEFADRYAVDMTAKDRFDAVPLRILHHCRLKLADKTNRIFDPLFDIRAERPVTETETAPKKINQRVKREQKLVTGVTNKCEPLHVLHHCIELVSVYNENSTAIRRPIDGVVLNDDVAVSAVK